MVMRIDLGLCAVHRIRPDKIWTDEFVFAWEAKELYSLRNGSTVSTTKWKPRCKEVIKPYPIFIIHVTLINKPNTPKLKRMSTPITYPFVRCLDHFAYRHIEFFNKAGTFIHLYAINYMATESTALCLGWRGRSIPHKGSKPKKQRQW